MISVFRLVKREDTTALHAYPQPVTTIQDIRRANLRFLLQEIEAELGTERGAAAELSRRTTVQDSVISQFLHRRLHASGKERGMGDMQARRLESGMGKPEGWLDVDRTVAHDWQEAALLDKLRALTPEQRALVATMADQFIAGQATPPD